MKLEKEEVCNKDPSISSHFPSIGSEENSEKIRGPPGDPKGPSTPLFRPLKNFLGPPGAKKVKKGAKKVKKGAKKVFFGSWWAQKNF